MSKEKFGTNLSSNVHNFNNLIISINVIIWFIIYEVLQSLSLEIKGII